MTASASSWTRPRATPPSWTPACPAPSPAEAADAGEHSGHEGHGGAAAKPADPDPAAFDAALAAARGAGLGGTVTVSPAEDPASAWTVAQKDNTWPVHYDQVAVDTTTSTVTAHTRWADYPLLAKLSKLGVQGHMGNLFGLANQLALAAPAIGLSFITVLGYRMWWQRRPTRADRTARLGKAPARGVWRRLPIPALVVGIPLTAAIGWALPVLGVTLLAFLVADVLTGLTRRTTAG